MGETLNKPDLATRAFMLSAIFELMRQRKEVAESQQALKVLIADLQVRLDVTFTLNEEHRVRCKWHFPHIRYLTA